MKKVHVEVTRPYDVLIAAGLISKIGRIIRPLCHSNRVVIITDDIVNGLYGDAAEQAVVDEGMEALRYVFPNGESAKSPETLIAILEYLAEQGVRKNDTLIALGGGVVGDVAGLAAAIYMRGISIVQIPTTLLAIVDSSIGGKTAINLKSGKNMAGVFWQPTVVLVDPGVLDTLSERDFAEGMGEVIKCGVIRDLPIIDYVLADTVKEHIDEIIENCITLKRDIVEQDELDRKGIRELLNAGHTVAHAIEKLSGYTVSHGAAVATGLVIEANMAAELGISDCRIADRIEQAVRKYDIYHYPGYSPEAMAQAMKSDKKNDDDRIVFVFPRSLGDCCIRKLTVKTVKELLR